MNFIAIFINSVLFQDCSLSFIVMETPRDTAVVIFKCQLFSLLSERESKIIL